MWEALSSPIMSERTRRSSSGVRAPATAGANFRRMAAQSTPLNLGSKKLSLR